MRMSHNFHVPPPQPPTPSAEVLALRTNWKWAYLGHFLFTYNPMLHLEDILLSELEDDLANGTLQVLPTVVQRLLIGLTPHDKRSILQNWQHHLRKQCNRRSPDHNLMGTEDEPVEFASLLMTNKLDLLQSLCEWQFHNPNNLRTRMKDDDEYANWRMAPIAYDAKANAYWLMGGNRLWIQYAPTRKRPRPRKRKQPANPTINGRKSSKRSSAVAGPSKAVVPPPTPKNAAASSAMGRLTRGARSRQTPASPSTRPSGTRMSTRLRGRQEEELWQAIPEEWLREGSSEDTAAAPQPNGKLKGKRAETETDSPANLLDDISELTSLSDLSNIPEEVDEVASDDSDDEDEDKIDDSPRSPSPDLPDGDSWETLCVTLAEWEAFPQRFEGSTHRKEKAFHKLLVNELVPMITEVLRVDVRKKHIEEAVVHRKRSSRIAVKESMREAERAEARRKADEEKEMERHRRWEARARKEEEERIRREALRSIRLREKGRETSESVDVDVVGGELDTKLQAENGDSPGTSQLVTAPPKVAVNGSKNDTSMRKEDEPWELDCEICHRRGMNLDDGLELMSCERCNKWQHILCHDQADFIAGRPRRNWETVDFLCSACRGIGVTTPRPQSSGYLQGPALAYHNGVSLPLANGDARQATPKQPESRVSPSVKPVLKPQTAYTYNSVQMPYGLPPQPYPPASQFIQRPQNTTSPGVNATRPTYTLSQSQSPYASTPNVYLPSHTGAYPVPRHRDTVQPHDQQSQYRSQAAAGSPHATTWLQQQASFNQLTPWNPVQGSASPQPPPQQNGYYRPHASTNPLMQSQQTATSAQKYYTGSPTSKS